MCCKPAADYNTRRPDVRGGRAELRELSVLQSRSYLPEESFMRVIGLFLLAGLVMAQAHDGSLRLASEGEDRGTTVKVTLPA